MGFEDEVEQSLQRPCRQTKRQVQADMRTHLIPWSRRVRTVPKRPEHMLKYCTRLHLVGWGHAFPDSSNHFAHERIVLQGPSPRKGLFKRQPDIVGENA